jgi:hypothetical protein
MGENLGILQFADWITNKICEFAICGSIKRNLQTRVSQKFADLWLRIEPKNLQIKKTVAWPPLQIYSGALGKLIHEKSWSRKSRGTVPLNFLLHVQNCTKWKPLIHTVIPCQLKTISHDWIYLKVPPPPTHTSDFSIFWEWRGWISRAVPRKCSPLAQIRREQKKPGPLLLVYFMLIMMVKD